VARAAGIDPDDRDRGARPEPLGEAAGADQLHPRQQPGVGPQLFLGQVERIGRAADQARDRHVAALVVQGRQQPAQGGERVRDRAAVHPAVHAVAQGPHFHGHVGAAAQ
jgi:hypothetical protein